MRDGFRYFITVGSGRWPSFHRFIFASISSPVRKWRRVRAERGVSPRARTVDRAGLGVRDNRNRSRAPDPGRIPGSGRHDLDDGRCARVGGCGRRPAPGRVCGRRHAHRDVARDCRAVREPLAALVETAHPDCRPSRRPTRSVQLAAWRARHRRRFHRSGHHAVVEAATSLGSCRGSSRARRLDDPQLAWTGNRRARFPARCHRGTSPRHQPIQPDLPQHLR